MVAAAFIGPGTVTTATMAGAGHGYVLLWAVVFSTFATILMQEMSARLGVVGGMGVGEALRQKFTTKWERAAVALLVISAILIGNAAYEAGNITGAVLGFEEVVLPIFGRQVNSLLLVVALLAFLLLFSGKYKLIERSLVAMVGVMGVVFCAAALLLRPDFWSILRGMFVPALPENSLMLVVGLIGTTVVPYNLFLHASSARQKWSGPNDLPTSRWDTFLSVGLGGIITMAILVTAAAAFSGNKKTIGSAAELGEQLAPVLGDWAAPFVAMGFLAAGLSSAITAPLAAAFATSEVLAWDKNLKNQKFRLVWLTVLLVGLAFSSIGLKPTKVILFAQVANGLLLPIVASFLLWIMNDRRIMGSHINSPLVNVLGILTILITIVLGFKGIATATFFK